MKKKISAVLSAIMMISFLPSAVLAAGNTISSAQELQSFRDSVNNGNTYKGQTVTLSSQLDLSSITWTAIGTEENPFMGTFDGGGNKITGLTMSCADKYAGLFGYSGGTIKNLGVASADSGISQKYVSEDGVSRDKQRTFAAAVCAYNDGSIENCTAEGVLSSQNGYAFTAAGGIAGENNGTISGCTNKARISANCSGDAGNFIADAYAGGVCGINEGIITSSRSEAKGLEKTDYDYTTFETSPSVYAQSSFSSAASGGVVGDNRGTVSDCSSSGTVGAKIFFALYNLSYAYSGGISGSNTGTVSYCSSDSYVWALHSAPEAKRRNNMLVGGISGYNKNEISNCTFSGKATSGHNGDYTIKSFVGGVCGFNYGKISACEFAKNAAVTDARLVTNNIGNDYYSPQIVGGICGKNDGGVIELCKSNGTISPRDNTHESESEIFYYGGIAGVNGENGIISQTSSRAQIILDNDGETIAARLKKEVPTASSQTKNERYHGAGLAGKNSGRIENCFYAPTGTNNIKTAYSAGLVSVNGGVLENCYANYKSDTALIVSADGIANTNTGFVRNCLYYSTSGITSQIDGAQKTFTEFRSPSTYADYPIGICWSEPKFSAPTLLSETGQYAYSGGSGTAQSPYIVKTAKDLYNIRFNKSASFKIVNDIAVDGVWSAIGDKSDPFTGTINGNHHTVTLAKADGASGKCGIIAYGKNCRIENLNVSSDITADGNDVLYVGAVMAYGENAEVENCAFSGNITASGKYVYAGGVAGKLSGTLTGCRSNGTLTVTGTPNYTAAGGICGLVEGTVSESDSQIVIGVSGVSGIYTAEVGGICGAVKGDIEDCQYNGTITNPSSAKGSYTGGLVGNSDGTVTLSYSDAIINANGYTGGIAGLQPGDSWSGAYYNESIVIANQHGIPVSEEEFTNGTILSKLRHNGKYIWTAEKETDRAVPLHITPKWVVENGFTKIALDCNSKTAEIYYTTDGSNPVGSGERYTQAFLCDNIDNLQYYAKDGNTATEIFNYGQTPVSKYPMQFTQLPENQNGEKITSENIASATSVTVKFLSETKTSGKMYLAFYDENGVLKYAKSNDVQTVNGENKVTFTDVNVSNVSSVKIFVWDGTLTPYTPSVIFGTGRND